MAYLAGNYSATYGGSALGQIDDGFSLDWAQKLEEITSDSFKARQDGVYQGIEMTLRFVLNEPKAAGVKNLVWPWATTEGDSGIVGRLMSALALPLVLTRCTSNAADPATITFTRAVVWTDQISTEFALRQRKISVSVAVLPVPASAAVVMGCAGGVFYTST